MSNMDMPTPQAPREPAESEIPLIVPITSRSGDFLADAYMQNAIIEVGEDGERWAKTRPGMEQYTTFSGAGLAVGQGLWYENGFLWAATTGVSSFLTRIVSPTSLGFSATTGYSTLGSSLWRGRRGHCSVVFRDQIMVIGGTLDGVNQLSDVWGSENGRDWIQICAAAPWGLRQSFTAVVFNNRLYVLGGNNAGTFLNDVWVSDDGVTWNQVTANAGWAARGGHSSVVFNNGIWVMGGTGAAIPNDVWFSTDGANWVQMTVAAGWAARANAGLVTFNDAMYFIGGSAGANEVWRSVDGITWTLTTGAAFGTGGRSQFACLTYNGAIYVICGFIAAATAEIYKSTDGITFTAVTGAFGGTARVQPTAVVFKAPPGISAIDAETYYILGGSNGGSYFNDVWYGNIDGSLSTSYFFTTDGTRCQAATANNNAYFCVKDLTHLNIVYQNQVQLVTDPNYPKVTVPGLVNLDDTLYVMDPDGVIHGSAISKPFLWPSRNFIGADYFPDGGVALERYNNYVLALGTQTYQLFYNSGAPGPTPLRPVKNANGNVGCVWPYSVAKVGGSVIWVGTQETKGRQVYWMNGMKAEAISSQIVEGILDTIPILNGVTGTAFQEAGHSYYILRLGTGLAIAYDLSTKQWFKWEDNNTTFSYDNCATDGSTNFFLYKTARIIYASNPLVAKDATVNYRFRVQTPRIKNGTAANKFCNRVTVMGDTNASGVCELSYSDNDYETFSTPRVLTLKQRRVTDTRFGRYIRRAWRLDKADGYPWRVKVLDTEIRIGNN